jgi:DNA-binding IclR family transcriptional regulator
MYYYHNQNVVSLFVIAKMDHMPAVNSANSISYFSKPFEKAFRVLDLFRPERTHLRLKEIADSLDIPASSAFRFCNTLVELDFLKKDPRTKLLSLGSKAYVLGLNMAKSFSLRQVIMPILDRVHEQHGVTIDLCILEGDSLVQVYYRAAKDAPFYPLPYVNRFFHCSSIGKSILAFLPEQERTSIVDRLELVKRTGHSITDKKTLLADLGKTRKRGYGVNNEECFDGQIVIGAPFFSRETGRPVGAVSFDFSTFNNSLEKIENKYLPILFQLAKDLSAVIE